MIAVLSCKNHYSEGSKKEKKLNVATLGWRCGKNCSECSDLRRILIMSDKMSFDWNMLSAMDEFTRMNDNSKKVMKIMRDYVHTYHLKSLRIQIKFDQTLGSTYLNY